MALANIRERLRCTSTPRRVSSTRAGADSYEVRIVMPYVRSHDTPGAAPEPAHE